MDDEVIVYETNEVSAVPAAEATLAIQAGLKILDTVKDIVNTKISEEQATERVRLQMRALTKINQDRCATIVEMCREYTKQYGMALEADAKAAQDCRDAAREIIMSCIEKDNPDPQLLEMAKIFLYSSMDTRNVNELNKGAYEKILEKGVFSLSDSAGQSVKALTQFADS